MHNQRNIILKGLVALAAIIIIFSSISRLFLGNSETLAEYAERNNLASPTKAPTIETTETPEENNTTSESAAVAPTDVPTAELTVAPILTPAPETGIVSPVAPEANTDATSSDAEAQEGLVTSIKNEFYYAPLTEEQKDYITGCSYPETDDELAISYDDLSYVHVIHYNFEGNLAEGELICNNAIAEDLVDIFYELYLNEYQIEKIQLIENYDGDDNKSMEDNNTSCFNYRVVEGSSKLSQHAYGLAIDINPFYNPYVTYKDGGTNVAPAGSEAYADRDAEFPYKIDENDLCYKLFKEHGFTWGGNWNSSKDYQHFQKAAH